MALLAQGEWVAITFVWEPNSKVLTLSVLWTAKSRDAMK
jgi:hypothetical protein